MGEEAKYLHKLEQIGAELRACANSMEGLEFNVRMYSKNPAFLPKLKETYEEYLQSHPSDTIDALHQIIEELKQKGDELDREILNADLDAANGHAVRLCKSMLTITKLITGG